MLVRTRSEKIPKIVAYGCFDTVCTAPLGPKVIKKIPLAPMGVLAPVSAHAGPSAQPPIGTSGIFPVHVSAE